TYPVCHPFPPSRRSAPVLWYASGIWRRLHDQRSREAREKELASEWLAPAGRADNAGATSATERGQPQRPAVRTNRAQSMAPSDRRAVRGETYLIPPNSGRAAVQAKNNRI